MPRQQLQQAMQGRRMRRRPAQGCVQGQGLPLRQQPALLAARLPQMVLAPAVCRKMALPCLRSWQDSHRGCCCSCRSCWVCRR